jgi:hypothetical protein
MMSDSMTVLCRRWLSSGFGISRSEQSGSFLKLEEVSFILAGCELLTRTSARWVFNASVVGNDAEQEHPPNMLLSALEEQAGQS